MIYIKLRHDIYTYIGFRESARIINSIKQLVGEVLVNPSCHNVIVTYVTIIN